MENLQDNDSISLVLYDEKSPLEKYCGSLISNYNKTMRNNKAIQLREKRGCYCVDKIYDRIKSFFGKQNISPLEVIDYLTSNGFRAFSSKLPKDAGFLSEYKRNETHIEVHERPPLDLLGNPIPGLKPYAQIRIRKETSNEVQYKDFRGN